jgi:hypothetical protein
MIEIQNPIRVCERMLTECSEYEKKKGGGQHPPIMMSGKGATSYAKKMGIKTLD